MSKRCIWNGKPCKFLNLWSHCPFRGNLIWMHIVRSTTFGSSWAESECLGQGSARYREINQDLWCKSIAREVVQLQNVQWSFFNLNVFVIVPAVIKPGLFPPNSVHVYRKIIMQSCYVNKGRNQNVCVCCRYFRLFWHFDSLLNISTAVKFIPKYFEGQILKAFGPGNTWWFPAVYTFPVAEQGINPLVLYVSGGFDRNTPVEEQLETMFPEASDYQIKKCYPKKKFMRG